MATVGKKSRTKAGTPSQSKIPPKSTVGSEGATTALGQGRIAVERARGVPPPGAPTARSIAQPRHENRGTITPEERRGMIAEEAYLKAEGRGFQGGSSVQDWLEAEAEIDAILMQVQGKGAD